MLVVIDTNVLVAALKSQFGASYAIISQLPSEKFQIALSIPLYLEYQDVLTRTQHMTGSSTHEEILAFLRYLCRISHQQDIFFLWRPYLRDPNDDMVLELAVASQSRYIITHNQKDFAGIEKQFGITPIVPCDFLNIIRKQTI